MTSINWDSLGLPAFHRDPLYIKSTNNDLITFAKEIRPKMDPFSTYIFTDATSGSFYYAIGPGSSNRLGPNARVLISFIAPTSGQSLILRLKHYSKFNESTVEVTLGSKIIQVNPSSTSWSLMIDDITLYPIPGPSESDHLSFEPGIRNDIVIHVKETEKELWEEHDEESLDDIELLDESGLEYKPDSSLSLVLSN